MRKVTIDVDTLETTRTGPVSVRDAAAVGLTVTMSAVMDQAQKHGWELAENALTETCAVMWEIFREERAKQENA